VWCSVLLCVAAWCNVLQCVTEFEFEKFTWRIEFVGECWWVIQFVRECCSVLLCVATWCNVLQCVAECEFVIFTWHIEFVRECWCVIQFVRECCMCHPVRERVCQRVLSNKLSHELDHSYNTASRTWMIMIKHPVRERVLYELSSSWKSLFESADVSSSSWESVVGTGTCYKYKQGTS